MAFSSLFFVTCHLQVPYCFSRLASRCSGCRYRKRWIGSQSQHFHHLLWWTAPLVVRCQGTSEPIDTRDHLSYLPCAFLEMTQAGVVHQPLEPSCHKQSQGETVHLTYHHFQILYWKPLQLIRALSLRGSAQRAWMGWRRVVTFNW